ncbi:MAG: class I SAM-dependent methyltransferase [Anaerolineales bacterium]|nr:class I SAM-dependent methyltransferase [Anaerolineales bacterium]
MECCQCEGIEARFDKEYVANKLQRYREKGPKESTRILIEVLEETLDNDMTLLDIGSGIGDIQHALLGEGVKESYNCEASSAFIDACKQEAERQGNANRITHIKGDFVDIAENIPTADIVTLDRVICCYHDMPDLVIKSLAKARKLYAIVIPIDKWWVKLGTSIYYNLRFLIQRNPFRVFVHPTEAVETLIINNGFRNIFSQVKGTWQIAVYEKT